MAAKFDKKMVLSLDQELYDLLFELGEVSDKPAATMVREILQGSMPQLRQSVKMLRQIRDGMLTEAIETGFAGTAKAQMQLFEAQKQFHETVKQVEAIQGSSEPKKARVRGKKGGTDE